MSRSPGAFCSFTAEILGKQAREYSLLWHLIARMVQEKYLLNHPGLFNMGQNTFQLFKTIVLQLDLTLAAGIMLKAHPGPQAPGKFIL